MKVVHSCTSSSFSGLEGYVLELASWQYRKGRDVELFCREGGELEERARTLGLPVWVIAKGAKPGPLLWARLTAEWRQRLAAGEVVLHMHAGGEPSYHLPALKVSERLARRLRKSVLHYHIWINHKKRDPFHRLVFSQIDEVWTSSESARAHLATLLPITRERIRVVPYGRDVRRLQEAPHEQWREEVRARLGLPLGAVLAVCISRLEPIKGVGELFEAFVQVAPKIPEAHLALVGGSSPENAEAERFAAELHRKHAALDPGIRARLHLMGFVSPSEPVLAAGDFYVLPSYEECMSLAMLDAVILGLPLLGTNSGGTPSVARPDETGFLVPPRDAGALAAGLERLFTSAGLRAKLAKGARELGSVFDRERIFEELWRDYRS